MFSRYIYRTYVYTHLTATTTSCCTTAAGMRLLLPALLLAASGSAPPPAKQKPGPLLVFVLAGQSNMEGQAQIDTLGAPDCAAGCKGKACTGCNRNGSLAWLVKHRPDDFGFAASADGKNWTERDDVCESVHQPARAGRQRLSAPIQQPSSQPRCERTHCAVRGAFGRDVDQREW